MNLIKKLPRLIFLNLLWLLTSLPVITIGPATCAAFAVALRLADDDDEVASFVGILRRYFKAFKQDILQGLLIFIFTIVTLGLGGYLSYLAWDSGLNLVKIAALFAYFLVVSVFLLYSYPLIARYSNSFKNTLRNSVALFLQYLKPSLKTLIIVIVEAGILALTFKFYFTGLIIIPSLIFYTVSSTAKDIFVRLENPTPVEEESESEENSEE